MSSGNLEPMAKLTDWQWKEIMVRGCKMIDEFLKELERPIVNPDVEGKPFPMVVENFPLLTKPARRDVEVLIYAGKLWWRQPPVKAGQTTTRIKLGMDQTPKGTKFTVVAMTTEKALTQGTYPNLPDHRTKSSEVTLVRG